jgi:hypothetical protein
MNPETRWGSSVSIALASVMCGLIVACASSTRVAETGKPGVYAVSASATGGRLAWARAHERAVGEARDYCRQRGMQPGFELESTSGIETLEAHDSLVRFECHPVF